MTLMMMRAVLESRAFRVFISVLIVISMISFSFDTVPDLDPAIQHCLDILEYFTIGIFTLEYFARIATAKHKLKFVFSFYGLIDLISILPFYLALAVDLRSVRALQLLRLVRVLKVGRYGGAMDRFLAAIRQTKEELLIFSFVAMILLYLSAMGIYYFEHAAQPDKFQSLFDCIWWAAVTLTTVGYGDIYPITVGGRIFTVFILLLGLGLVAIPTGIVASALSVLRRSEVSEKTEK
jgi:voltage-gated potassium channel